MSRQLRSRTISRNKRTRAAYKLADKTYKLPERTACPTPSKRVYPGRKEAKAAAKVAFGVGNSSATARAYKCRCGRFHVGKPPPSLVRGEITRAELNGPA